MTINKTSFYQIKHTLKIIIFGFSLIELLVVISIIAILSGSAAMVYPAYVAKSQVTHTIALLGSYAKSAENFYLEKPSNSSFTGINMNILGPYNPAAKAIVSAIEIETPVTATTVTLTATFNGSASSLLINKKLSLTVQENNGIFSVTCFSPTTATTNTINSSLLPKKCGGD